MAIRYFSGRRGFPGFLLGIVSQSGNQTDQTVIPAVVCVDATGTPVSGGGGGGGGAVTVADGADVAQGTTTDAAWSGTGAGTAIAILKAIWTAVRNFLPAAADRSGTATTTSGGLSVAANASRRFLVGQNISAVNIGFNEQGGTAAIGTAGTYTVPAGQSFSISGNKLVNFIAASGTAAVTMTEG